MEAAAVAGAAGVATAVGAFDYNRENFKYDAEQRWERFTSAREYANQQAEQYRADLRSLAALTQEKTKVWCITATLCMALCVALYCAGRLGLHGPSPPAWIMGLWMTNNAAAFGFMALCQFLAMHAGFRAQAASVHLLTRKVRVPIPTLKQLDEARKFASEFEQQDVADIFRVPFLSNNGAPRTDDAVYQCDGEGAASKGERSQSAPPSRRGLRGKTECSSWVRDEFENDRALANSEPPAPEDAQPEHFRLFQAVQKQYYQYDIYARICIFYGFVHYVQSLCYYGLGHINIELRAFWVAYGCVFVIAVLQALMLRFDIIPSNPNKKQYLPYCEYLGPIAVLPAAIAMSIDFQVQFDLNSITICWILIFVSYVLQLIYSLRMLEVVLPDGLQGWQGERLGNSWLPNEWRMIPSSFYHVLYFVTPPQKLQPGQHDLVREVKEGGVGAYYEVVDGAGKGPADASGNPRIEEEVRLFENSKHIEPWRYVARLTAVLPAAWIFLIGGTAVDLILGEQALVTAPHWSRPPMTRLSLEPHELSTPLGGPNPAGDVPWTPEEMAWHEEKRHVGEYHIRRLSERSQETLPAALAKLMEALPSNDVPAPHSPERISWPSFFEPRLLACAPSGEIAAITPRGFGAAAHVARSGEEAQAERFMLSGLMRMSSLIGASWGLQDDSDGLLLTTQAGHLAHCPGPRPSGGAWACEPDSSLPGLPLAEGARLHAATASWLPSARDGKRRLHAAMIDDGAPGLVGLFEHDAGSWVPLGEVKVPGPDGPSRRGAAKVSVAFVGGDLLVTTGDGHMLRRQLKDGALVASGPHSFSSKASTGRETVWQGACGLPGDFGDVAHLQLQRTPAASWLPEVHIASAAPDARMTPDVFN